MELKTISIEDLKRELKDRVKPKPTFVKDGKEYFTPEAYNRLLEYYDEYGVPKDFSPMEFNRDGSPKVAEPQQVVINLEAALSNRVYQKDGEFHVVIDTWSIREQETGDVTLQMINEYVLTENKKAENGYDISMSAVTREDFVKYYKDSFGMDDMLNILKMIDDNAASFATNATVSLSNFSKPKKSKKTEKTETNDDLLTELAASTEK